jgi:hypothetical protein
MVLPVGEQSDINDCCWRAPCKGGAFQRVFRSGRFGVV